MLGLAYPAECRVCGGAIESWDDGVACRECWEDPAITEILKDPICSKCGEPTRGVAVSYDDTSVGQDRNTFKTCRRCDPLPFAAARSCGTYSGAFEANILFLKSHPHVCRRLRDLISRTFTEHRAALESDVIVPVPLHRLRERARGFNQAEIIARVISGRFDLPLGVGSLVRARPTERHRAGVDALDRAESVEGAFRVTRPRLIGGASILAVDDVMTTGSTISAVARTLLEAGARRVCVLTIARVAPGAGPLLTHNTTSLP